jgi:hypothetical protein
LLFFEIHPRPPRSGHSFGTHGKQFDSLLRERFGVWKKNYNLKDGISLNYESKNLITTFEVELRSYVANHGDFRCIDIYSRSPEIKALQLKSNENTPTNHRYFPIVQSVCAELEKGFNSYPNGWGPLATSFELESKMELEYISTQLSKSVSDFFSYPNEDRLYQEILLMLGNLKISSKVQFTATATIENDFTPEFDVSVTNEKKWALRAINAGEESARELNWTNITSTEPTFKFVS